MTRDPGRSRSDMDTRARNYKVGLAFALVNVVVWAVAWATGGTWFQGVLALCWLGLAVYVGLELRRLRGSAPHQD